MPPTTGNYSKGIDGGFLEAQRLAFFVLQKGIPFIDADFNRSQFHNYALIRRALGVLMGNASPNNGFRIQGDGANNDVNIQGGDGTLEGAGRMWVGGYQGQLLDDIRYVNAGATDDELSIFPTISFILGLSNEILQDTSANYTPGALVGRTIVPDVTQPLITATIVSNTTTNIETSIDLTAAGILPGARYRINMSTPSGGDRNDGVYLDLYLDEIDGSDIPNIRHDFGTLITAGLALQVQQHILIVEGDPVGLPGGLTPLTYVDADGFEHFLQKIADIERFDGVAAINAPDVTDLRATAGNFTNFLNKNGDNMTGDLVMQAANIILDPTFTVDGRDVSVDGAKLDTIDFTGPGVATLLPLIDWPVQALDLTGVTTSQIVVGASFLTKTPGGTDAQKGVITDPPENTVIIQDPNGDDYLGGTDGAQKVAGRLTENHPTFGVGLQGTWTFTNASNAVVGVGGAASTELVDGDIVQGPDGLFYLVNGTPAGANNFSILPAFAGVTDDITNPTARRWLLDLVMNDEGTEVPFVPTGPIDIVWFYREIFDVFTRPVYNPLFTIPSDQVAAEVPDGTTAVKGKVQFAPDLGTSALQAVQGSDQRVNSPIQAKNAAGVAVGGRYAFVRAGSNITLADFGGGDLQISAASGPAPGGQTDTVSGTNGITNTGTNVNAVLQPVYGTAANTVAQGNDPRFSQLPPADFDSGFVSIDLGGGMPDVSFSFSGFSAVPRLLYTLVGPNAGGPFQQVGNGDAEDAGGNRGITIFNISASGATACPHIAAGSFSLGYHGAHVPTITPSGVIRLLAWE